MEKTPLSGGPSRPDEERDPTSVLDEPTAGGALVRGGTLRIGGYAAGVLISVVGAALMIRHLGVADFGRYATVLSVITIVGGLSDLGLTGVGTREYTVRPHGERERLLGNLLGMRLVLTTAGIGAASLAGILAGYPAVQVQGLPLAGIGLLLIVTQDSCMIPLNAQLRQGWIAALDLMRQVALLAVVIVLVFFGAGLLPFLAAQIPGGILAVLIAISLLGGPKILRPRLDVAEWRFMTREVLPYAAAAAIGAIYFRVEIVTLSAVAGSIETGLFGAAFRITEVVAGIPPLIVTSALPLLARAAATNRARLATIVQRMFDAAIVAAVALAIAVGLGAGFALDVVAGGDFEAAVSVLQIQAATVAFTFPLGIFAFTLLVLRQRRVQLVVSLVGLTVAIALTVVLAPAYGARGGAVALVTAEATMAMGFWLALRRLDGMQIGLGAAPRVLLAAGVAVAVPFALSLPSLPAAVVGELIFLALLVASDGMPSEWRHLLPRSRAA